MFCLGFWDTRKRPELATVLERRVQSTHELNSQHLVSYTLEMHNVGACMSSYHFVSSVNWTLGSWRVILPTLNHPLRLKQLIIKLQRVLHRGPQFPSSSKSKPPPHSRHCCKTLPRTQASGRRTAKDSWVGSCHAEDSGLGVRVHYAGCYSGCSSLRLLVSTVMTDR